MFGFLGDYAAVIDCAKHLQDHIDEICVQQNIPDDVQVSVSLGPHAAVIEVEEIQVWHSECDSMDITPEAIVKLFQGRCTLWTFFADGGDE